MFNISVVKSITESKKEIFMENNTTPQFTASEMNMYRPVLRAFGSWYGKKITCPMCDNVDLNHKDKEKKGVNPRFANPVKKFYTKSFDLVSFRLIRDANNKACIVINEDASLTYPLTKEKPEFTECTAEKITDALAAYDACKKLTFFTDFEAVNREITRLNEQNAKDLDEFAQDCINFASMLRGINASEKSMVEEYYRSLDQ